MAATHAHPTVPTRRTGPYDLESRARHEQRRQQLLDELRATDAALAALAKDRRRLLEELEPVEETLWPQAIWPKGRRPGPDSLSDPLPPLPDQPLWLWGRQLRAVCLRMLTRCGALALRQLHALLHLHGFGVAGDHPVKALADALGHETDSGNAHRLARGRYRAAPQYRPPRRRGLLRLAVPLPDLEDLDA